MADQLRRWAIGIAGLGRESQLLPACSDPARFQRKLTATAVAAECSRTGGPVGRPAGFYGVGKETLTRHHATGHRRPATWPRPLIAKGNTGG